MHTFLCFSHLCGVEIFYLDPSSNFMKSAKMFFKFDLKFPFFAIM